MDLAGNTKDTEGKLSIGLLTLGFHGEMKEATKITILLLAKALQKRGHKVIIISDQRPGLPNKEVFQDITVYRRKWLGGRLSHHFGGAWGIKDIEKQEGAFDIIHNFSSAPVMVLRGWLAKKRSKNKNIKLIHTIKSRSRDWLGTIKLARFLNLADAVTVQSHKLKQELLSNGVDKKKLRLVHSHVDTKQFVPMDQAKLRETHKHLGLKKHDFVVFYYGPFVKRKGIGYLLKAIPLVWQKNKNIKFLLSCKTRKIPSLYEQLIAQLGICQGEQAKNVHIMFSPETIPPYLNMGSMVVMPYPALVATETNPSCIIESMACKVPVIMSDLPELREFFMSSPQLGNSAYFKPKSEKAIAERILAIAKDAGLRKKLTDLGFILAKNYDLQKIVAEYEGIYQKVTRRSTIKFG